MIHGLDITPYLTAFYADEWLHPNDLGFSIYARNVYSRIQEILKKG